MEEYLNLYHQKMWEIAYENLIRTFFHLNTIILFVLFLSIWYFFFGKKRILLFIASYFFLFLLGGAVEYVNSYDKIMSPDSIYNKDFLYNSLIPVEIRLQIEYVDEQPLSSVDGELKKADVILFAVSAPRYYAGLFTDTAYLLTGEYRRGKSFLVALVGYEEKDGEWESVDIRIAPGKEKKDFQKFSKILHIKKAKESSFNGIVSYLQELHEKKLESEKNR